MMSETLPSEGYEAPYDDGGMPASWQSSVSLRPRRASHCMFCRLRGIWRLPPTLPNLNDAPVLNITCSAGYEASRDYLRARPELKAIPAVADLAAGFAAEALSCLLWVPIDVTKERLQVGFSTCCLLTREAPDLSVCLLSVDKQKCSEAVCFPCTRHISLHLRNEW